MNIEVNKWAKWIVLVIFYLNIFGITGQNQFERIVTEHSDVINGVEIDYRYSEISTSSDDIVSAPGCPKSDAGYPWLQYGSPPSKCYLAGTKGPCGPYESFFLKRGSINGQCYCGCLEGKEWVGDENQNQFCVWTEDPPSTFGRELVYIPEQRKCLIIYDQGPCKSGEWLVKVGKTDLGCETKTCLGEGNRPFRYGRTAGCFKIFMTAVASPGTAIKPHVCKAKGFTFSPRLKYCVKQFNFDI